MVGAGGVEALLRGEEEVCSAAKRGGEEAMLGVQPIHCLPCLPRWWGRGREGEVGRAGHRVACRRLSLTACSGVCKNAVCGKGGVLPAHACLHCSWQVGEGPNAQIAFLLSPLEVLPKMSPSVIISLTAAQACIVGQGRWWWGNGRWYRIVGGGKAWHGEPPLLLSSLPAHASSVPVPPALPTHPTPSSTTSTFLQASWWQAWGREGRWWGLAMPWLQAW